MVVLLAQLAHTLFRKYMPEAHVPADEPPQPLVLAEQLAHAVSPAVFLYALSAHATHVPPPPAPPLTAPYPMLHTPADNPPPQPVELEAHATHAPRNGKSPAPQRTEIVMYSSLNCAL